jgi:hypothetical protein
MAIDLDRMLDRCAEGQWRVDDFDWDQAPVPLAPEQERQLCAYYTNMAYIERLAGALFRSLADRVADPTLAAVLRLCHADEVRHSHAAARLADHFDVRHLELYAANLAMLRFGPAFVRAIDELHPAFATSFILGGELILDVALLRSLNRFVDDPLARAVVERINQDESRHIAMDMFLAELLASPDHGIPVGATNPWTNLDYWQLLAWGPEFFAEVFFRPMQVLDPSQAQLRDAIRRFGRFYDRPRLAANPAVQQFRGIVDFFESQVGALVGNLLVDVVARTSGVDLSFVRAAAHAAAVDAAEAA